MIFFFNVSSPKLSPRPRADVAQAEESAGQRLLDMEEQQKQRQSELEEVEERLRQCTAKSQMSESELQYPSNEWSGNTCLDVEPLCCVCSLTACEIPAARAGGAEERRAGPADSSGRGGRGHDGDHPLSSVRPLPPPRDWMRLRFLIVLLLAAAAAAKAAVLKLNENMYISLKRGVCCCCC